MATFEPELLKCKDEVRTLKDVVYEGHESFPVFVKICGSNPNKVASFDLPDNTEILLQRQFKENFAHVKVLQFYDNTVANQEYGPEYVLKHENYVGKEYLLPLSYGGNIKFVLRPGSAGIYKNISQVITDGQGLVQLENSTEAMSANDPSKQVVVKAKTSLEIKRKFQYMNGCLIECSDGKRSYAFKEDDCVNCTAVDDNKTHNLIAVRKCTIFPRVIHFVEKVNPEKAVLKDREMNSAMQGIMEGPLELSELEERELIIGTIQNKKLRTFETVLIPKPLLTLIYVRKRSFTCSEEKEKYINRKYEPYSNIKFVNNSLYFVPIIQDAVVWLMNPALCKPRLDNGITVFDVIPIPLKVFSDDEFEDEYGHEYHEIRERAQPVSDEESEKVKRKSSILKTVRSWAFKPIRKLKTFSLSEMDIPPEQLPKPDNTLLQPVSPDRMSAQSLKDHTIGELYADNAISDQLKNKNKRNEPIKRVSPISLQSSQYESVDTSSMKQGQGQDYIPLSFDDPKTRKQLRPPEKSEISLLNKPSLDENGLHSLISGRSLPVAKPIKENWFTSENEEPVEISNNEGGNYETISDDALDNSEGSKSKSDDSMKIAQKSFLHSNIEAPIFTKQCNLSSCNRNDHRLPDEFDEDDNDNGDYEPVMGRGHTNRIKIKNQEHINQSLNEETTAQERNSFLHSNMFGAKTVDKRKEENSKTRRDVKSYAKVDGIPYETCSGANINSDNTNMQNVELIEKVSKESNETQSNDNINRTTLKSNTAVDKRENTRISKERQEKVLKDDQTEADFYNYTVAETAFCFETCGLDKLAEFCLEQKLDGSFFKHLDSDFSVLCQEAKLSKFYEYALRSIIREGYRKHSMRH